MTPPSGRGMTNSVECPTNDEWKRTPRFTRPVFSLHHWWGIGGAFVIHVSRCLRNTRPPRNVQQRAGGLAAFQLVERGVHVGQSVAARQKRFQVEPAAHEQLAVARVVAVGGVVTAPRAE